MPFRARRTRAALLLVVGLLASLVVAGVSPSAVAADDKGLANGTIKFPQKDSPGLKMLWFDKNWNYLGQKSANGGGYSIWLSPGTYHLQFVDQRPSYEVTKYAPTDIKVTVHADDITTKNVTMRKGAAITGTVRADGKPLKSPTIYAALKVPRGTPPQSWSTVANKKGQFAIGGLPEGKYCLFTYDRAKRWVGKCTWAGVVKPGQTKNTRIGLTKRAGSMTVYLFTKHDGDTDRLGPVTSVTVTSKQSGQWWTAKAKGGTAVFKGLYLGGYTLKFDGAGVWLPKTGNVQDASVRSGTMAFGKFVITRRGGWVTGTVVDGGAPDHTMKGAQVLLFDASGTQRDSTTTNDSGRFTLDGQLTTQSGMTIVVNPDPSQSGWMQGESWCMFERTDVDAVSITAGWRTEVGDVELPRSDAQGQPVHCQG